MEWHIAHPIPESHTHMVQWHRQRFIGSQFESSKTPSLKLPKLTLFFFQERILKLVEEKTNQTIKSMLDSGLLLLPNQPQKIDDNIPKNQAHVCQPINNRVYVARLPSRATLNTLRGNYYDQFGKLIPEIISHMV